MVDQDNHPGNVATIGLGKSEYAKAVEVRRGMEMVWDKLCVELKVMDDDLWQATAAVNEARNTLRNKSDFSPRQWVFGSNGRLVPDPEDESDLQLSALSQATSDEKMAQAESEGGCSHGLLSLPFR